jgi:hypothetical protein
MKALLFASALAVGLLVATLPVTAHHSMAGFDRKQTVTLEGTVEAFRWENPHSSIEIVVPDKAGKAVTWQIEMTAPAYLARTGWKRTSIKKGDQVTIVGNPLISGDPGALFVSIKLPDGSMLPQPQAGKGKSK